MFAIKANHSTHFQYIAVSEHGRGEGFNYSQEIKGAQLFDTIEDALQRIQRRAFWLGAEYEANNFTEEMAMRKYTIVRVTSQEEALDA